jgi:hypothetical protein
MSGLYFKMTCDRFPYKTGDVVRASSIHELQHYVGTGAAFQVDEPVKKAAADARAAKKAELPAQEEKGGEDVVGADVLPEAPKRGRKPKTPDA